MNKAKDQPAKEDTDPPVLYHGYNSWLQVAPEKRFFKESNG
jgi:hypothetical protein